jgi:hypothetical protein
VEWYLAHLVLEVATIAGAHPHWHGAHRLHEWGLNGWLSVNELWGCVNLGIGGRGGVGGFEASSLKNLGTGGIGDGCEQARWDFKYL